MPYAKGSFSQNKPFAEQPQSVRDALDAANLSNGLAPKPASIWVGGYEGNPPTPFAQIRSRGGPRLANWQPEAMRRIDLFAYGKTYLEADALATTIDEYLRRLYNYDYPGATSHNPDPIRTHRVGRYRRHRRRHQPPVPFPVVHHRLLRN